MITGKGGEANGAWLKAIKPMLPGVRFISSLLQSDSIRNADVVWIQTNAISHSDFYIIIDAVRKNKIPIRYFTNASAEKCARQLAAADQKE